MPPEVEAALRDWVIAQGLAGADEADLLEGFCTRAKKAGLGVSRGLVLLDTLHPSFEGRAYRWRDVSSNLPSVVEYGRTSEGDAAASWRRSPFYAALQQDLSEIRLRVSAGEGRDYPVVAELADEGITDYLAFVHRVSPDAVIGEMDCIYSHWTTRQPEGFADGQVEGLRRLVPALTLAMKSAALARVPRTLAEVYLGQDPARRVLGGRIVRGVADHIATVLWFSDLRGYSSLSDTADPNEIIPLLNDYAEATIESVHDAGGDVLKLMGDGVLAMFPAEDAGQACRCALRAEHAMRARMAAINEERTDSRRPLTTAYVGLHVGEVFYGNIGSRERLDFTVIGPAVNEVSRIASLCRSVDRGLLVSADFRDALPASLADELVNVGRYALRGVGRAQNLYTLDPEIMTSTARSRLYESELAED
jgi:adenylate cyclase